MTEYEVIQDMIECFDALPRWVQALWGVDKELALDAHRVTKENEELRNRNEILKLKLHNYSNYIDMSLQDSEAIVDAMRKEKQDDE